MFGNRSFLGRNVRHTVVAGLGLVAMCGGAGAEAPTNLQLLSAMPPGTESVMILRLSALRARDSILRDDYRRKPRSQPGDDIKTVVTNAIGQAKQMAFTWGGSDFTTPSDTGMTGNFNERAIYIVEKPLDELLKRLETGTNVEGLEGGFEVAGVKVFQGKIDTTSSWARTHNSAGEPWFVAIPNPNMAVTAESRADIAYMLKALASKKAEVPVQWRTIAKGRNLESPILILRQYPRPSDPRGPGADAFLPPVKAQATHFALILPGVSIATLKLFVAAKDPTRAVHWVRDTFLFESDFAWEVKSDATSASATLVPLQESNIPPLMGLKLVLLFGTRVKM